MSHEVSDTIQGRDGRWYNVYGEETGATQPLPLPKVFAFERPSYSTPQEAANVAAWRSRMGEGQYPSTPPGYGFTNSYQASPQAQALGKVIEVLQDPRNAWMGLGPLSAISKTGGWGAEALRRYKLMGGTPQTLNQALINRATRPVDRNEIVSEFRKATDLAVPKDELAPYMPDLSSLQGRAMRYAGLRFNHFGQRPMLLDHGRIGPASRIPTTPGVIEKLFQDELKAGRGLESATQANAAYGAVSRQVARMLDQPGFQFGKGKAQLPTLEEKAFLDELPIEEVSPPGRETVYYRSPNR